VVNQKMKQRLELTAGATVESIGLADCQLAISDFAWLRSIGIGIKSAIGNQKSEIA
jgi:hypothetical protein